jgi:hypothetical protein
MSVRRKFVLFGGFPVRVLHGFTLDEITSHPGPGWSATNRLRANYSMLQSAIEFKLRYVNFEHGVGVFMPPSPIGLLIVLIELGKIAVFAMTLFCPYFIRLILMIVPLMIVVVIFVVVSVTGLVIVGPQRGRHACRCGREDGATQSYIPKTGHDFYHIDDRAIGVPGSHAGGTQSLHRNLKLSALRRDVIPLADRMRSQFLARRSRQVLLLHPDAVALKASPLPLLVVDVSLQFLHLNPARFAGHDVLRIAPSRRRYPLVN